MHSSLPKNSSIHLMQKGNIIIKQCQYGEGVFATADIVKGTKLFQIEEDISAKVNDLDMNYEHDDWGKMNAKKVEYYFNLWLLRSSNSEKSMSNITYNATDKLYFATRDIKDGEELSKTYPKSYWISQRIKPFKISTTTIFSRSQTTLPIDVVLESTA